MATQSSTGARDLSMSSKVAASSSKPTIATKIRQPMIGKQNMNGSQSMPGSKGKGQSVTTVQSNPISGAANKQKGNTAMGAGGILAGII